MSNDVVQRAAQQLLSQGAVSTPAVELVTSDHKHDLAVRYLAAFRSLEAQQQAVRRVQSAEHELHSLNEQIVGSVESSGGSLPYTHVCRINGVWHCIEFGRDVSGAATVHQVPPTDFGVTDFDAEGTD